ncbi:ABC transporter ATP-binding protein [Corynebacterium sp. SCR221107]|uniref:ABC transporter ATP-binding protein n=1 Tax=Corynebacterium sp. SCR221107 TaxID=3017361 RepID=UPI0022EC18C2|nr:ABC transporter ATP-binding protein [Corynebacterium sp. SCR221107]WBT08590.1 ABC transporter ATP-binding protein [Corynebacterium sp. SCR221107]
MATLAAATPAIEVRDLCVGFGPALVLDHLDLQVLPGTIHGFLGPNGAGKSTTIRTLLGLLKPQSGRVRVLGQDPWQHPEVLKRTAYVPGDVSLWPQLTGAETLRVLERLRGVSSDRAREAHLIEAFCLDTGKRIKEYSTGNRRKVMLVAALSAPAELLLLDEPTAGLDPLMEQVFVDEARAMVRNGVTVLLSSHIMSQVEKLCDSVTLIKSGRAIESGAMSDIARLSAEKISVRLLQDPPAHLGTWTRHGERIERTAARDEVPALLKELVELGAQDFACQTESLEETFRSHYQGSRP